MKELARFSTVDATTLTRSVDQLVADRLIERHIPPKDQRKVVLFPQRARARTSGRHPALLVVATARPFRACPSSNEFLARVIETILRNLIGDPEEAAAVLSFARSGPSAPRPQADR